MDLEVVVQNKFGSCEYSFEEDYVHIYNLYVLPEYRNLGKAKELLNKAINEIKLLGYKEKIKIVADPKEPNIDKKRLIKFYKSLGLEVFEYYE